jgi:hypothetical protein
LTIENGELAIDLDQGEAIVINNDIDMNPVNLLIKKILILINTINSATYCTIWHV